MQRIYFLALAVVITALSACDHNQKKFHNSTMTELPSRVQPLFEKTKTVCFGRFVVDVPESTTTVWGDVALPLAINVYPNGIEKVRSLAQKFVDELKNSKAIYHENIPLLISEEDVTQPDGKIIVGYENFVSINALKINGYFKLDGDGVLITSRPLMKDRDNTITLINSIARRLRKRNEDDIPTEPGNCFDNVFLMDEQGSNKEILEHVRIGFRLKDFPDAHLSIYVAPSNPDNPEGDSLQAQWTRIKQDFNTPEEKQIFSNTKFFRESPRVIQDWKTGYEVLTRSPDEDGSHSHHDFQIKFIGVPHDLYKPYADIQFQTGVADNAAGATKASLTDEEAIAVWDKITSTIRVRPTTATPAKNADTDSRPRIPLGELAATGRTCPQTGWWQPSEAPDEKNAQRQHIKAGERMPHVVALGEPSLWEKLKGERPSYRTATVWKLVSYDDPPAVAGPGTAVAKNDSSNAAGRHPADDTPPQQKG